MREFLAGFECTIDFGLGASLAATAYRVRILQHGRRKRRPYRFWLYRSSLHSIARAEAPNYIL